MIEVVEVKEYQFKLSVGHISMTLSETEAVNLQQELEQSLWPNESYEELRQKVTKLENEKNIMHRYIQDFRRSESCQERITTLVINI